VKAPAAAVRARFLFFVFALAALVVPAFARAQANCPPAAEPPALDTAALGDHPDHGFLWRIEKGGRSSWLYGTMHVARRDWAVPGSTLVSAIRASDVVALELDVMDPAIMQRMVAAMAPRPQDAVGDALKARLLAQIKAACLPDQLLSVMSPEMAATSLVVMAARREGLDPAYAIDRSISVVGHGLGRAVVSLETPELQIAALRSRTHAQAQESVAQTLDSLENGEAAPLLRRMAEVWAEGRFSELDHYEEWCMCMSTESERALMKRLLDERNPGMAQRIDAMHSSGKRVFAAVGSLHMIGPTGLPQLLARRGYKVERVEFEPPGAIARKP
jgi:uncharacterized protein YbaP (TraB family)